MTRVNFADWTIAQCGAVFIIAEAGVNHDGSVEKAFKLVDAAVSAGVDCVKFQAFKASRVAIAKAPKAKYQKALTDPSESQIAMLQRLELSDEEFARVATYCKTRGILFLATPYNREDVELLEKLDVAAFKLASISIAEPLFLSYVADRKKPLILSAGMATLAEIDAAIRAIRQSGNEQIILLQCTTDYPADPAEANLLSIPAMHQMFGVVTGYSDHTESLSCCIAATALGAAVIERHITLDRGDLGPDHAASSDPDQFRALVRAIRETRSALGTGIKVPTPSELQNIAEMRRSIVLRRSMKKGNELALDDLDFRRPGSGIRPDMAEYLSGARLTCDVSAGEHLGWSMLENIASNSSGLDPKSKRG